MAARFVNVDYDPPLFLPPELRDWVPAGHLAHFILDVVEEVDLQPVRVHERGSGSEQYPPRMLLALLLYCYATGVFSSRRLAQATRDSVPVRMISAGTRPDHDTLRTFRRENQARLQATCVRVLELAPALKFLQVGQSTVAVDGTKVLGHASKHSAVSHEHAGKTIGQLDQEVKELLGKAKYKLRQQTVEPVFGIIKSIMGFRQFLLRGKAKARLEWQLVCTADKLKRLHLMGAGWALAQAA